MSLLETRRYEPNESCPPLLAGSSVTAEQVSFNARQADIHAFDLVFQLLDLIRKAPETGRLQWRILRSPRSTLQMRRRIPCVQARLSGMG